MWSRTSPTVREPSQAAFQSASVHPSAKLRTSAWVSSNRRASSAARTLPPIASRSYAVGVRAGRRAAAPVAPRPRARITQVEIPTYAVLIVGGGLAGIRAAIAAVSTDPRLRVAMASKVYPMRSHTVSAEGGCAAVLREPDSFEGHAFDTIKGSDYLADQDVVEIFVREAPLEIIQLEHWGCPWSREPDGHISVRPFGGLTTWRTCFEIGS